MSVFVAILVFSVIILVHELGHFLVARWVGIEVEEFSIGFGPKLAGFTATGTKFSVRLIPMGGYVKMLGEEGGISLDDLTEVNRFLSREMDNWDTGTDAYMLEVSSSGLWGAFSATCFWDCASLDLPDC